MVNSTTDTYRPLHHRITKVILKLIGWQVLGEFPPFDKCVIVGAPHTSNWDFVLMLLLASYLKIRIRWVGKESLFRPPYGWIMLKLGGIPVNRSVRARLVDQIVESIAAEKELKLVITPEGTRGKSKYWKSGFYYIALGANVPIVLVSVDFPTKTITVGPNFSPTGDIKTDFEIVSHFYKGKRGKFPNQQGEIAIQDPHNNPAP